MNIQVTLSLVVKVCPTCGVTYGFPEQMDSARRKDGQNFYCPNGHNLYYPGSESDSDVKPSLKFVPQTDPVIEGKTSPDRQPDGDAGNPRHPKCPYCGKQYWTENSAWLKRHIAREHSDKPQPGDNKGA